MTQRYRCNAAHCMHSNNDMVRAEDYDKLETRITDLEQEVRNWRKLVNQDPDKAFDDGVLRK